MNPTAQEFFDEYLAENAALYETYQRLSSPVQAKFFSAEYIQRVEAWRANRDEELFEMAEVTGPTAKMLTVRRVGNLEMRHRYQLRLVEEKWEIHTHENTCLPCQGTGQHDGRNCKHCHGEGWTGPFKDLS